MSFDTQNAYSRFGFVRRDACGGWTRRLRIVWSERRTATQVGRGHRIERGLSGHAEFRSVGLRVGRHV